MTLMVNQLIGFGATTASAAAAATVTFIGSNTTGTDGTSFNFGSFALGSYDYIVVCVSSNGSNSATVSSITVGGSGTTVLAESSGANTSLAAVAIIANPTGSQAVVLNISASMGRAGCSVFGVSNLQSASLAGASYKIENQSTVGAPSGTIDCDANGVIIGGVDFGIASNNRHSAASDAFASAQSGLTVSCATSAGQVDWTGITEASDSQSETSSSANQSLAVVALR